MEQKRFLDRIECTYLTKNSFDIIPVTGYQVYDEKYLRTGKYNDDYSTYEGDTVVLLHSNNKKVYRGTQIKVRLLSDPVYQAIIPNLLSAV